MKFPVDIDIIQALVYYSKVELIFRAGCKSLPAVQPASQVADPVGFRSRQYSLDERR